MNHFTRRCGCGAIFSLVHLRDRSTRCVACQRKQAASMERARAAETLGHRYLRAIERALRAKAQERAATHACESDAEQVGCCEMPLGSDSESQIWQWAMEEMPPCP